MPDLADLFEEENAKALEKIRKEMAAEDAAWKALPESEKLRIMQEREAKMNALFDETYAQEEEVCDNCGEFPENCECDDEHDEDE